jgi:Tfp pilus assembly protein PilO
MIKINLKKNYYYAICLKTFVIIGTIFFILNLGYFFCLRAKLEIRENCYLSLLALEKELNKQIKISSGPNYREEIKNLKNKFDIFVNDQLDKLIFQILSGQLISPVFDFYKINFLSIKNKEFLISLQGENDLSSTNNLINFLNIIARLDKFILIENFRWNILSSLLDPKKQNIFFLFRLYSFYSENKNLILALSKTTKIKQKCILKKALMKFPLNKIKMIGYYSYNKVKNFGFVLLPNKEIFKVQLGDQLGLDRDLVIGINDQQIFILNKNFDKIIRLSIESRKLTYVKNFWQ